ncbi:preprotein translocase subunit Tim44 [Candidatus Methylacidiphilum fumarolicum]|uniref:Pyruvate decarboxylase or related thiamine pyrophosphate-requiring enzyme n=2 Tax=Candidatus Methylacidiphilum fumarolicum TaxID=591154 RepID=I0K0V4_METFB|nr:thiamine pyrophosphate-binding protein [Candidatus Methylacidiphilum fumarolicum]MBW6414004.1 alpha-keto acid decarboxylase family protein [Candidatus Methylacidiphilum fumarolicum]TFE66355.1 preprotein translocase subunit Tim44 [Candidatus Methylacidiphilum fumarolicum]TFE75305.1 preprotein translocase subunit Tim44 [Candidatus Methylacidiphilum fumarolicum]TFE76083.1 preprotein translocase subunit Tim44 [Candidatus Methylacidiphilum fumarolicum]TFE77226.1 preprotein translocase subunit Ti
MTTTQYLARQLLAHKVQHVFGVPGDYSLKILDTFIKEGLQIINTCDEQGAGFAADAYARLNGLSAVCITYCVGGLKVTNPIAEAYAEKSPVLVISGAPGISERKKDPLLHHKVKDFNTQLKVFEALTVFAAILENPRDIGEQILRAIQLALQYKRPAYLEIPRDMASAEIAIPDEISFSGDTHSDLKALEEALTEAKQMIEAAAQPLILADVEIQRFGLQKELEQLTNTTGIPVSATLLGKSVIAETHPHYIGVYEGATGSEEVCAFFEKSDCLILLGVFMTDITLGSTRSVLDMGKCIYATSEKLMIRHHTFEDVRFEDFVRGLLSLNIRKTLPQHLPHPSISSIDQIDENQRVSVNSFFTIVNAFLSSQTVVIADVGESLFGSIDLVIHESTEFISPAYYASVGFSIPAAIGAALAKPHLIPFVICGDGAFQMTGIELSTTCRYKLHPIILLLNNSGYSTERIFLDGPFNDLVNWNYSKITELLGCGRSCVVKTNRELKKAIERAIVNRDSFWLIEVVIDAADRSMALRRMAQRIMP